MISNPLPNISNASTGAHYQEDGMDSIANICWYPSEPSRMLAYSSWDSKIRICSTYLFHDTVVIETGGKFTFEYPCLALAWVRSTTSLVAGFLDGTVAGIDSATGQTIRTYGKHDDVVQAVYQFGDGTNTICSVSYDSTLKLWDIRNNSNSPVQTLKLGDKAVCSDMMFPYMAIGLSNQNFHAFDINQAIRSSNIQQLPTTLGYDSPLSDISLSKELAIGIDASSGRSALSWLKFAPHDPSIMSMDGTYCFKGHKSEPGQNGNATNLKIMYPINAVGMHPKQKDTYFTAGRDGYVHFWNITKRSRLSGFQVLGATPITKAKYSPDGVFLALGTGYDWSNGIEGEKSSRATFYIHKVRSNEVVQ